MQTTKEEARGILVVYGPVTVDEVKAGLNSQKFRAQLRQTVTKTYPGPTTSDSLSDALFAREEFAFKNENNEFKEERVTWVDVPVGTTKEQTEAQLATNPNARLVRHLSLNPILSDEQASAIQNNLNGLTLEKVGAGQVVLEETKKEPVDYKGYLQFRTIKFKTEAVPDVDKRPADYEDMIAKGIQAPFQMANPIGVIAALEERRVKRAEGAPLQMAGESVEQSAAGSLATPAPLESQQ